MLRTLQQLVELAQLLFTFLTNAEPAADRLHQKLTQNETMLDRQQQKMEKLMSMAQDFTAALGVIDTETTRIGTEFEELLAKFEAGGMTAEEETAALAEARRLAVRLKTIAADPANPVPPVEPAPAE